jgi:hypothetical protein
MTNSDISPVRRGIPLGYALAAIFSIQVLIVAVALFSSSPGWL